MKKVLLLSCIALIALTAPASSQVLLGWDACGGPTDLVFNCAGPGDFTPKNFLIGTFVSANPQPTMVAMDGQVDLQVSSANLPDFWKFSTPVEPGNCNQGIVFGDERPSAGCASSGLLCGGFPLGGQCDVAFFALTTTTDPLIAANRSRFVFSIYRTSTTNVAAGTDYFSWKLGFFPDLASEAGGPCVGCSDQAAFVWNSLILKDPSGADVDVATPACATWNGGTSICAATPTQNKTWGALKSLYR